MITISDEKIREVLQMVIEVFLIPKFLSLGMNASGSWINSLTAEAQDGKGYIKGKDYTFYLVNGRAPGTPPPIAPLIGWVANKLGKTGPEGLGIAFAIQKKIAAEGTDYYPAGTDLLEVLNSPEVTQFIYTDLSVYLRGQLETEIKRRAWQVLLTS